MTEVEHELVALERAATTWARRAGEASRAERARHQAGVGRTGERGGRSGRGGTSTPLGATSTRSRGVAALESTIGQEYRDVLDRLDGLGAERRTGQDRQRALFDERPRAGATHRAPGIGGRRGRGGADSRADEERVAAHRRFVAAIIAGLGADAAVAVPAVLDGSPTSCRRPDRSPPSSRASPATNRPPNGRAHASRSACTRQGLASVAVSTSPVTSPTTAGGCSPPSAAGSVDESPVCPTLWGRELEQGRAEFLAEEERLLNRFLPAACAGRWPVASASPITSSTASTSNSPLSAPSPAASRYASAGRSTPTSLTPSRRRCVPCCCATRVTSARTRRHRSRRSSGARVDQAELEPRANAPWEARLRETLDYRSWHRFTLQLGHRDWEGVQPATPRRLQRLSTGERSIVLHLPMLASIAAHYTDEAGQPAGCPRLILLDELFAGVDAANRSAVRDVHELGPRRHLHQRPRVVPVRNVRRHRHPPSPSADGRRAGDVDSIHMGWSTALDRPDGGMTNDGAYACLVRPGLQPLVDELARRFGDGPDPPTAVTLRLLTQEQRSALADLMGSPYLPPATTRIRVEQLCATVDVPDAGALRVVVETLRGPIPDRRSARDGSSARMRSLWLAAARRRSRCPLRRWGLARRLGVPRASGRVREAWSTIDGDSLIRWPCCGPGGRDPAAFADRRARRSARP